MTSAQIGDSKNEEFMASLGVLCKTHPEAALKLLLHSLGLGD